MSHENITPDGYSAEEDYFFKLNKKLIEDKRKQLDEKRKSQESESGRTAHWMKCPKCGSNMSETYMKGIMVDQCSSCGGIYFDRGELELLLRAEEPKGFLAGLSSMFK